MTRVLTALVMAPAAVALVLWAPGWAFLPVVALVALLSYREYGQLVERHGIAAVGPVGYAAGLVVLLARDSVGLLAVTLLTLAALVLAISQRPLSAALPRASALILGVVYVFGAWRCGIELRELNRWWLLFALAVNWVGDTAAFYVGRGLGRHKLAPEVSPAKTWEGAAASMLAALLFGLAYARGFMPSLAPWQALAAAAASNLAGQLGDLAESALKRGAGVKDSGGLFPGHGGCLDRTDGVLFTMPVLLALLSRLGGR